MTERLQGKTVAITGASSGIGAASARALAAEGAFVVLGARRRDRLEQLAVDFGDRVEVVEMDVRDPEASRRLVSRSIDRFGRLDALVANAGIGAYGGIMDLTDDQLATMMDTNVAGTVWPIRAAVPDVPRAGLRGHRDRRVRRWSPWCRGRSRLCSNEVRPGRPCRWPRPRAPCQWDQGEHAVPRWYRNRIRDGCGSYTGHARPRRHASPRGRGGRGRDRPLPASVDANPGLEHEEQRRGRLTGIGQ